MSLVCQRTSLPEMFDHSFGGVIDFAGLSDRKLSLKRNIKTKNVSTKDIYKF